MKKLSLEMLVAKTPTEYTQLAIKLINNQNFRTEIQKRMKQIDLSKIVFQSDNGQDFKKAIDFLLQNHEHLQKDASKTHIPLVMEG